MRCVLCGCSRLDSRGFGCALCGGPPGLRSEQCHVSEETNAKLWAHAEELKRFGIGLEEQKLLQKSVDGLAIVGLGLAVAESLNGGILRKLILYLRDIAISESEILRLRLDEPENVSDVLKGEDKTDNAN
jgi:hypothetical protein